MPTFIAKGPLVPDELVQDLEDDRVIIFCGAGISMDAGLPSFVGLVRVTYEAMGATPPSKRDPIWLWPDRMLGELETRSLSGLMRNAVRTLLDKPPASLEYHKALLRLARLSQHPGLRLVTTNFDTYFEQAEPTLRPGLDVHSGPVVPIPRDDRSASWRSVVYLHGRLEPSPNSNDHLIMTSADFGRAYLTDGWAARFVARLFADFSVLFVGYSLNDPVLRYMTDAFAAEARVARRRSARPQAYIFVPYRGRSAPAPDVWRDRGLEPIFYHNGRKHRQLRETLTAWAAARDDWLSSTATLIAKFAASSPETLTPSELSNVLWALFGRRGDEGYGTKLFAELDPAPPVEWLRAIEQYEEALLAEHARTFETATRNGDTSPAPPLLPLRALTVARQQGEPALRPSSYNLGRWFLQHLAKYELVDWVAAQMRREQRLHPQIRALIRSWLVENPDTLKSSIALFWRIVSAEGVWTYPAQPNEYVWDLRRMGGRAAGSIVRAEFLALLRPFIRLTPSTWRMDWAELMGVTDPAEREALEDRFSRVAEAEVELVGGDLLDMAIETIEGMPDPDAEFAAIADDLSSQLKAALDLWALVQEADSTDDPGRHHQPSIRPHDQNRAFHGWTRLIDLLWRGWKHVDARSAAASRRLVERWQSFEYPTFHRMVLQAIGESAHWTPNEKLKVLLHGFN